MCHKALEAVRRDHLGQAMSMRAQLMTDVTALRQGHKQSVKDYVAEGRQYLVRLREVGVEQPATLLIPCFKAGNDARMKPSVLPSLNQEHVEADFEALAQEFQRVTVSMPGASGNGGQAMHSRGEQKTRWEPKKKHKGPDGRTCYVWQSRPHRTLH
jgi:hypothetical protein